MIYSNALLSIPSLIRKIAAKWLLYFLSIIVLNAICIPEKILVNPLSLILFIDASNFYILFLETYTKEVNLSASWSNYIKQILSFSFNKLIIYLNEALTLYILSPHMLLLLSITKIKSIEFLYFLKS